MFQEGELLCGTIQLVDSPENSRRTFQSGKDMQCVNTEARQDILAEVSVGGAEPLGHVTGMQLDPDVDKTMAPTVGPAREHITHSFWGTKLQCCRWDQPETLIGHVVEIQLEPEAEACDDADIRASKRG